MNIQQFKLIVSDLDGTLIRYGSDNVSPSTKKEVQALQQKGHHFTLATGRSWKQTRHIAKELDITLPVILQAGAIVFDPKTERPIRIQPLRREIEIELRQILNSPHVDQFCLNESGMYYATEVNTRGGNWMIASGEECQINAGGYPVGPIIKHLFIGREKELRQVITKIEQTITPKPNWILWPPDIMTDDWFLEVFDPSASKGQALAWLANMLNVKQDEVMAFGDGHNDFDMIEWAGMGVVIERAPVELKDKADWIIPGPEQDGVAKFLKTKTTY